MSTSSTSLLLVSPANHFKGIEAVGGNLYVYADRVEFKSHDFNIQNHTWMLPFKQIAEVKFHNTLGIIPNGLKIINLDGKVEKFVVGKRKIWKEQIEQQILQHL